MSTRIVPPIVVGVDDTPTSAAAAERAAELARATQAPLHLVSAVEGAGASTVVTVGHDTWVDDVTSNRKQYLIDLTRDWEDVDITISCTSTSPARALTEHAEREGAEIIVVGNRRVQGASRVLGSVAGAVARHAPCDVYVVQTTH